MKFNENIDKGVEIVPNLKRRQLPSSMKKVLKSRLSQILLHNKPAPFLLKAFPHLHHILRRSQNLSDHNLLLEKGSISSVR
jgi:hypothetical protein